MHIFLNGLAASAGAGLTYLYNVVPQLAEMPDLQTTVAVQPELRAQFDQIGRTEVFSPPRFTNTARRFWFEQRELAKVIKRSGADVLISAGNFAIRNSPVPQILLSGNSLYTSQDFYRDLRMRGEYGLIIDTFVKGILAKKSVSWSDKAVAPSQAFAADLQHWTGRRIEVVYHGFNQATFVRPETQLSPTIAEKLHRARSCVRLLFVSHYNYYRNFETLFRALSLIQQQLPQKKIKLFLTCKLEPGGNPGAYDPRAAAGMIRDLKITEIVEELGPVPYDCLHHVYRSCDIYVTAAYTETFAHPLVEAMASGLPVVASDLEVHREVCADAAMYFPPFAYEAMAETIARLVLRPDLRSHLLAAARRRTADFSWSRHITSLLELANKLLQANSTRLPSGLNHELA